MQLRLLAAQATSKLGSQPQVLADARVWCDQRRAALKSLVAFAGCDAALLRRAAMIQAGDVDQDARYLLLDAAVAADRAEDR